MFWKVHGKGKPNKAKYFSKEFRDFTERLLAMNPENRMTIDQVFNHEWMKGTMATEQDV